MYVQYIHIRRQSGGEKMEDIEKGMFLFLCLQRCNKLDEYLRWFPHYAKEMQHYKQLWNRFVRKVHEKYLLFYVKKKSTINIAMDPLDYYVKEIHHTVYIPSLCTTEKRVVNKDAVKEFLTNSVPPLNLMMLLYN